MYSISIRALLVSSRAGLPEMVEGCLRAVEAPCSLVCCKDLDEVVMRPDLKEFEVALLDAEPDPSLVGELRALTGGAPVVLLTSQEDNTQGLAALRAGATDSLSREEMSPGVLFRTLRYAVERARVEDAYQALQTQLFQSQKMEAIGRLASGVAHDFKQFVQAIIGYCSILKTQLDPSQEEDVEAVDAIKRAGVKAGALVEQLLGFAKTNPSKPRRLDLNKLLQENHTIVKPLLGPGQQLRYELSPAAQWIRVDPNQLEQVVLNLVVNAVDAAPQSGNIEIRTRPLTLVRPFHSQALNLGPGSYSLLEVSDTGHGIAPEVLDKIFEPFFTTRENSGGTGLGLSTVFSLVDGWGGTVAVSTQPGVGTSFQVVLPAEPVEAGREISPPRPQTVFLCDPDKGRRLTLRKDLDEARCEVKEFSSLSEALAARRNGETLLLVGAESSDWEELSRLNNAILVTGLGSLLTESLGLPVLRAPFNHQDFLSALSGNAAASSSVHQILT